MRYSFILTIIIFCFGCATKKTIPLDKQLNGSWTPTKQEIGGKELPANFYSTQKLVIQDTIYTLTAESIDKGTLIYKKGCMDIFGKKGINKGKHFTALYKLENNQLIIIYNLKGDSYPTDFETKSNPTLFLSVFKKD